MYDHHSNGLERLATRPPAGKAHAQMRLLSAVPFAAHICRPGTAVHDIVL